MNWKVGDYFILPGNKYYKGVYQITRIKDEDAYWAYYPENKRELWSYARSMAPASKLHKVLL